jgi:hypothetical protein
VLIAADDALKSAIMTRAWASDEISEGIDKKFGDAIDLLSAFDSEEDFPSKDPTPDDPDPNTGGTATEAKMSKSPSTILHALKENLHSKVKLPSIYLLLHADES